MWVLINGLCKPSLEAPGYVTKILRARKWTSLLTNINCISENTDFDMENDLGFLSTLSIASGLQKLKLFNLSSYAHKILR